MTETIDKLFLELSLITTAKTARELDLERRLAASQAAHRETIAAEAQRETELKRQMKDMGQALAKSAIREIENAEKIAQLETALAATAKKEEPRTNE